MNRRKHSLISTTSALSSHPLRQTSFPPDGSEGGAVRDSRSPSMDTMSMLSGSVNGPPTARKKKRGRKPKNAAASANATAAGAGDDTASSRGRRATTAASGASGGKEGARRASAGGGGGGEGEEEDEADETAIVLRTKDADAKADKEENERRAILFERFDAMQQRRFGLWRSAKFSETLVRRLVNQTLSQSAPASVILAVRFVTKMFVGQVIERARKVQSQWVEVERDDDDDDESQTATTTAAAAAGGRRKKTPEKDGDGDGDGDVMIAEEEPTTSTSGATTTANSKIADAGDREAEQGGEGGKKTKLERGPRPVETRRGPLTADHLREAVRRLRAERGDEAAGLLALWKRQQHGGVERFGSRTRGRRLLR